MTGTGTRLPISTVRNRLNGNEMILCTKRVAEGSVQASRPRPAFFY